MDYIAIYEIWHLRQFNGQQIALIVLLSFISIFTFKNNSKPSHPPTVPAHFSMLKGPYYSHFQIYFFNKQGLFG